MSVITIFSGIFCNESAVVRDLVESTGYSLVTDGFLVEKASGLSGIQPDKIQTAFSSRSSVFNPFTHEKERSIACLRLAAAEVLRQDNLILTGFGSLLIPRQISHALRVCLIAGMDSRLAVAGNEGMSDEDARQAVREADRNRTAWTRTLLASPDPWDPSLYDLVLPMGKISSKKASALIEENLLKNPVRPTPESQAAVDDFLLSAQAAATLADAGHNVGVESMNGELSITITRKVIMLGRLEDELKSIAGDIPGVESVVTRVEADETEDMMYWKHSSNVPSKVLLVDDEREFVQTLSERLQMRDMGCVVAFDGESALDLVLNDAPEVMIIDLKMPRIDGMEVLSRVKEIRPGIEVIILTGHGSEQDRKTCMEMGAFAYMHKPIDINELSSLLHQAHEKVKTGA